MTQIHINVYANFEIDILIHLRDTEILYLMRACLVSAQSPGRKETRLVSQIARHNDTADPRYIACLTIRFVRTRRCKWMTIPPPTCLPGIINAPIDVDSCLPGIINTRVNVDSCLPGTINAPVDIDNYLRGTITTPVAIDIYTAI